MNERQKQRVWPDASAAASGSLSYWRRGLAAAPPMYIP